MSSSNAAASARNDSSKAEAGRSGFEQLAADLRRLAELLEATYDTEQPAKMQRVTAAALAYDWVLLSACRTLEVSEPAPGQLPPLDPIDRLTLEAALARRGLAW